MVGRRGSISVVSIAWRLVLVLCAMLCLIETTHAQSQRMYDIDLPAQNVADALNGLSLQTGVPVVFPFDLVKNRKSHPVIGRYLLLDALHALLENTGLSGGLSDRGVVTISVSKSRAPQQGETSVTQNGNELASNSAKATRVGGIAAFFTSIVGALSAHAQVADSQNSVGRTSNLDEIIVTAQKREERLQDTPVPVTVLNADQLAETSQVLLRDYYSSVPGLVVVPNFISVQNVSIRGISAGAFGNPTVSILVDGVPFTGSGAQIGNLMPEIDPGDLARIEVLRGPQGTLYGAESMGGLINYVTRDPSTDGYSGRIESGTSTVYNGSEPGFEVRGSVNIPLSNTFAIRASVFRRQDPGYIDNVLTGQDGVNERQADGARLSAKWQPSGDLSVKVSGLYEHIMGNGVSEVDTYPGLRWLQQERIPDTGTVDQTIQSYSAIVDYKFWNADLTSVTGFNTFQLVQSLDATPQFGVGLTPYGSPYVQTLLNLPGISGMRDNETPIGNKFNEEVRLAVPFGKSVDWLLGGYYTRERSQETDYFIGENPTTGQQNGVALDQVDPEGYEESAVFSDVTYKFTDQFNVQVGGREAFIKYYQYAYYDTGAEFGPVPRLSPASETSQNAFTYLVTPQFKITSDWMAYARFASGYRLGGNNTTVAVLNGAPAEFGPDKTKNYELGTKGEFLDHTVSVDASLYYIDWIGLQTQLTTPNGAQSYTANAGAAKSEGVEFSVTVRPLSGLTLSGWVDYDDAALTKSFPAGSPVVAGAGARLPGTAKWSGNLSAEQEFPLWSAVTGFVGGTAAYIGDRENIFVAAAQPR